MNEKYDLNRMLREIAEETENKSAENRTLTQEEIKQRIANKSKPLATGKSGQTNAPAPELRSKHG